MEISSLLISFKQTYLVLSLVLQNQRATFIVKGALQAQTSVSIRLPFLLCLDLLPPITIYELLIYIGKSCCKRIRCMDFVLCICYFSFSLDPFFCTGEMKIGFFFFRFPEGQQHISRDQHLHFTIEQLTYMVIGRAYTQGQGTYYTNSSANFFSYGKQHLP